MNSSNLGALIKKLREEKQLSQRKVAEALDIDVAVLSRIENNNCFPKKRVDQMLSVLSELFQVSNEELQLEYTSDMIARLLERRLEPEKIVKTALKKNQINQVKKK